MTTLVVGDVHGCVDELDALCQRVGPDRLVLVGDLFTKGPDPAGVYAFVRAHRADAVIGNHDQRLLDLVDGHRPGDRAARACVEALDAEGRKWRKWLRKRPLFLEVEGFTVVHAGLHPSGELDRTTRRMALNIRRWPDEAPYNPYWHQVYYGARRVLYGHDARYGLNRVERHEEPLLVGLDTGCCYGGRLSGYVLEADRIEQVPARRVYQPIG